MGRDTVTTYTPRPGCNQDCGTGAQLLGSSSRLLNFLTSAATCKSFGLRFQNNLVH